MDHTKGMPANRKLHLLKLLLKVKQKTTKSRVKKGKTTQITNSIQPDFQ